MKDNLIYTKNLEIITKINSNEVIDCALDLINKYLENTIYKDENISICITDKKIGDLVEIIDNTDDRYTTYNKGFNLRFEGSPSIIMFPYSSEGIKYAVNYCIEKNLRPTVGSGRHCYENFVIKNDGGVLIDCFFLKNITKEEDMYIIEPGVTNWEMQTKLLANYNVTIPGGSCYSVAAGGHICGGGYGLLSRQFGLTVDYLHGVEIIVVDENKHVEIVKCFKDSKSKKERNLWWSHTGGGGGNFGIISKYYFKNLPTPPKNVFLCTNISIPWNNDSGNLKSVEEFSGILKKYVNYTKMLNDNDKDNDLFIIFKIGYNGTGGGYMFKSTIQSFYLESIQNFIKYVFGENTLSTAEIKQLPWLFATQTLNGSGSNLRFKNKSAYMNEPFTEGQIQVLYNWYSGSNNIPNTTSKNCQINLDSYGGQINKVLPTYTSSYNRNSFLKLQYLQYWSNEEEDEENLNWIRGVYNDMYGENGPSNGCYVNYPDVDLKNWEELYYSKNYPRLQLTKKQWDPNNIFHHAQSIRLP